MGAPKRRPTVHTPWSEVVELIDIKSARCLWVEIGIGAAAIEQKTARIEIAVPAGGARITARAQTIDPSTLAKELISMAAELRA